MLDSLEVRCWQVVQETGVLPVLLSSVRNGVNDSQLVDAPTEGLEAQNIAAPRISGNTWTLFPRTRPPTRLSLRHVVPSP